MKLIGYLKYDPGILALHILELFPETINGKLRRFLKRRNKYLVDIDLLIR